MTENMANKPFKELFLKEFFTCLSQPQNDNWDYRRFGPGNPYIDSDYSFDHFSYVDENWDKLEAVYRWLANESSRETFRKYYLSRILGQGWVKMPITHDPDFRRFYDTVEQWMLTKANQPHPYRYLPIDIYLHTYGININGYDIRLETLDVGFLEVFLLQQYSYPLPADIKVNPGDIVLDFGGCWGDTALYFAALTGLTGVVHAFEISHANIEIFEKNLHLNPKLSSIIQIHNLPISDKAGDAVWVKDFGAATQITPHDNGGNKMHTTTIDDFVASEQLKAVDFMKFDIEGAERHALAGAKKTISKFRPKLAVSVYHRKDDIECIINMIRNINNNYKFFLRGVCSHPTETVLFCTV